MRKIRLFLGLLLLIFFACTKENVVLENRVNDRDKCESHVIPVEQALDCLDQVLKPFKEKTRAVDKFDIENVEVVLQEGATRSFAGADTLLYIVNFKNDGGYALVGADDRAEGVIALIDEGSLTAEKYYFYRSSDAVDVSSISHYLFTCIDNYLSTEIEHGETKAAVSTAVVTRNYVDPWTLSIMCDPLLTTKWEQKGVFNQYCPFVNGVQAPAGCVAIAMAQIIAYNKKKFGIGPDKLAGCVLDWNGIFKYMTDPIGNKSFSSDVALLASAAGVAAKMEYGPKESTSNIDKAERVFESIGYRNPYVRSYSIEAIDLSVRERGLPAYMRGDGVSTRGGTGGHAWVVDGYYKYRRFIWSGGPLDFSTPHEIVGEEFQNLIHCNFGWGGFCNGFFNEHVLNLENGADEPDSGQENDHYYGITDYRNRKLLSYYL